MKIYTHTGDDGSTGLFGGPRVAKNHARIAAYGTIDELNSVLGLARASDLPAEIDQVIERLQHELFSVGSELASPEPARSGTASLGERQIEQIERDIDRFEQTLPPLTAFILPGGSPGGAALHVARCVCRRAEREMVTLAENADLRAMLLQYVNRVSDLLFVLARACNAAADSPESVWEKLS